MRAGPSLASGMGVAMAYNVVLNGARFGGLSVSTASGADEGLSGFVAGGLSGYIAAPLARARTLLQTSSSGGGSGGFSLAFSSAFGSDSIFTPAFGTNCRTKREGTRTKGSYYWRRRPPGRPEGLCSGANCGVYWGLLKRLLRGGGCGDRPAAGADRRLASAVRRTDLWHHDRLGDLLDESAVIGPLEAVVERAQVGGGGGGGGREIDISIAS